MSPTSWNFVYCLTHGKFHNSPFEKGLFCPLGEHDIAKDGLADACIGTYCCGCDVLWMQPTRRLGQVEMTCPSCGNLVERRYLCAECDLISQIVTPRPIKWRNWLTDTGAPQKGCPGCGSPAAFEPVPHACERLQVIFRTCRPDCPLCGVPIDAQGRASGSRRTTDPLFTPPAPASNAGRAAARHEPPPSGDSDAIRDLKLEIASARDTWGAELRRIEKKFDGLLTGVAAQLQRFEEKRTAPSRLDQQVPATQPDTSHTSSRARSKSSTGSLFKYTASVQNILASAAQYGVETVVVKTTDWDDKVLSMARSGDKPIFVIISQGGRWPELYAVPALAQIGEKQEFYSYFQKFYECSKPSAGEIYIVTPAVVTRRETTWVLKQRGEMDIR